MTKAGTLDALSNCENLFSGTFFPIGLGDGKEYVYLVLAETDTVKGTCTDLDFLPSDSH